MTQTNAIQVRRLEYRLLPTPFRRADATAVDALHALADKVGGSVGRFAAECGGPFDEYAIGSTLNSHYLSDPDGFRDAYRSRISEIAGFAPCYVANVYECTNWAFLLRHSLRKARTAGRPQRLLMQIVDADIHGLQAAWQTRTYGHARFGILLMDVTVDPSGFAAALAIGAAPVARSMMKFGSTLREAQRDAPEAILATPFFPEPTRGAFRKTIPGTRALPDYHDEYGHCFGADPWIALGLAQSGNQPEEDREYIVGSLALNGYHAVGRVGVPASAVCSVERPS